MTELCRRLAAAAVVAFWTAATAVPASMAADNPDVESLWFDPTQLPSFTGVVDRFLPDPDGHIDRLIFKEGPQIAFPPDAFAAIREVAPAGRPLVVWGIRARKAAVITMLAFAVPDGVPTVLDRFYWRPEQSHPQGRRDMMLIGTVWVPYLSAQGQTAGAILENGDVIRVEPRVAAALKNRFAPGAKIVAEGPGMATPFGRAIEAERVGESVTTLERVSSAEPAQHPQALPGPARPRR